MGQPVLRAEERGDGLLQGCQEHRHALQQRGAAQPLPLPLRRHQRLQEEEERVHPQVRGCFRAPWVEYNILSRFHKICDKFNTKSV